MDNKERLRIFRIIAIIAIIGFSIAACKGPEESDSKIVTPELTGTVSIDGIAQVEQTLTAITTDLGGSGTIFYQWMRGSINIGANRTYVVKSADVGSRITVTVTREGYSGSVTSNPTAVITDSELPALTGTVSISGTAQVGHTLTAVTTYLGGSGTISYQWKRETADIGTNSTYVVQSADVGSTITVTVTRDGYSGSVTSNPLTVNKATGATLDTPTLNTVTHNSITINPVTAPDNGQTIKYAINTANSASSLVWQPDTTFSGLNAATTYYIFAHAAENSNHETGTPSNSLTVITLQTVSDNRFEYYWVDQHDNLVTTSGGTTTVARGGILTITAQGTGYVVKQWHLNGMNTGQSENTYSFSSTTSGNHVVGLLVEKDGKFYNTNITITVQ